MGRIASALVAAGLALGVPGLRHVHAAEEPCPSTRAVAVSSDSADAREVCAAALAAETFLARCGIAPRAAYLVSIEPEVRNVWGGCVFGRFEPRSGVARVVGAAACRELVAQIPDSDASSVYRHIAHDTLYRSFAAHEIAHAIAHQSLRVPPSLAIHEYVAGVVQLATLPDVERSLLLAALPTPPDAPGDFFNDLVAQMDPPRFAAAAYRHFTRPGVGCPFLLRLLREEVLPRIP